MRNAALLCGVSSTVGCALAVLAFAAAPTFGVFLALFGIAELALFTMQVSVAVVLPCQCAVCARTSQPTVHVAGKHCRCAAYACTSQRFSPYHEVQT